MGRHKSARLGGAVTLGQRIRELREQQGMSLRALATRAGVSAPFLSDLEHGRRGTEKVDEIARALGADARELHRLNGKLTPELRSWLSRNPALLTLLQEVRAAGRPPEDISAALKAGLKRSRPSRPSRSMTAKNTANPRRG